MQQKKNNKKGQIFVLFITIFTGIVLFTLFITLTNKYENRKGEITTIGEGASSILRGYQQQEESLLYLDLVAKRALEESVYELADNGGFIKSDCGTAIYSRWNKEEKVDDYCIPDVQKNLQELFSKKLKQKLQGYTKYDLADDYEIKISKDNSLTQALGITQEKLKIGLSRSGSGQGANFNQPSTIQVTLSNSMKEKINTYDSIIAQAASDNDIPPALIKAIISIESGGNRYAENGGCKGLMQFCPGNEKFFGTNIVFTGDKNTDPRFDPNQVIPAGAKLIKENIDQFEDYSDKFAFAAASYNGGSTLINYAISDTGKKDPSWNEVKPFINLQNLEKIPYYTKKTFADKTKREEKIKEVQDYVEYVNGYYQAWGGQDITSGGIFGTYSFDQNFKVSTNFDLGLYDKVGDFVKKVSSECDNNLVRCMQNHIDDFNSKSNYKIKPLSECEDGINRVLYDFAENIENCAYSVNDNCICKISKNYDSTFAQDIYNTYSDKEISMRFDRFKFGGGSAFESDYIEKTGTPQWSLSNLNPFNTEVTDYSYYILNSLGYVSDFDNIFDAEQKSELRSLIEKIESDTKVEIAVVPLPKFNDFSFSKNLFNSWGVGKIGLDNGLMIAVSPDLAKVAIIPGKSFTKLIDKSALEGYAEELINKINDDDELFAEIKSVLIDIQGKLKDNTELGIMLQNYKSTDNKDDLSIISPIKKSIYVDTSYIQTLPNFYIFKYDWNYFGTRLKFPNINLNRFNDLFLFKKNDKTNFAIRNSGGLYEVYDDTTRPLGNIDQCSIYQKVNTFRLCMGTNDKIDVLENNKLQEKNVNIKFTVTLKDTVPPEPIQFFKVGYNYELDKVIVSWEELVDKTQDTTSYEIYYSNKPITKLTNDMLIKKEEKTNVKPITMSNSRIKYSTENEPVKTGFTFDKKGILFIGDQLTAQGNANNGYAKLLESGLKEMFGNDVHTSVVGYSGCSNYVIMKCLENGGSYKDNNIDCKKTCDDQSDVNFPDLSEYDTIIIQPSFNGGEQYLRSEAYNDLDEMYRFLKSRDKNVITLTTIPWKDTGIVPETEYYDFKEAVDSYNYNILYNKVTDTIINIYDLLGKDDDPIKIKDEYLGENGYPNDQGQLQIATKIYMNVFSKLIPPINSGEETKTNPQTGTNNPPADPSSVDPTKTYEDDLPTTDTQIADPYASTNIPNTNNNLDLNQEKEKTDSYTGDFYYEDLKSEPKSRKYYLFINKEKIKEDKENHYFALVAVDGEGHKSKHFTSLDFKIPEKYLVDYAQEYVGTGYGGFSLCSAKNAKENQCSTQCGSFVTNVYRYGLGLDETLLPKGNGINKCDGPNINFKFDDPNQLKPGDIFESTSPSSSFGHTGLFVGFGYVKENARNDGKDDNPYCYSKYTPDPNGDPVFIHSVGPVCYSTLEQLQDRQNRQIITFCRHNCMVDKESCDFNIPGLSSGGSNPQTP